MKPRTSLIGGSISFAAVIMLSWLNLDMGDGRGFFMLDLVRPGVGMDWEEPATLESVEDSIDSSCGKGCNR